MNKEQTFIQAKENALHHLEQAETKQEVDTAIQPILNLLNTSSSYYTSSSCSGRIVLLELPRLGDKQHACFLGKWHGFITVDNVYQALQKASTGMIWFLAQSPILHIGAETLADADTLVKLGVSSGFKNSAIRSLQPRIIVELCSTERLDTPLGNQGSMNNDTEYLELLTMIANQIIQRSQKKLKRFEETLRKHLSSQKSTKAS